MEMPLKDKDDDSDDSDQEMAPGAAIEYGKILTHLTHHPIYILKGGYERFSALYHFFRTQKIIWMPQELDEFQPYPVEIIPGRVFLGNFSQACDPKIQKDLKIKAHVNVSMETGPLWLLHCEAPAAPPDFPLPQLRDTTCRSFSQHLASWIGASFVGDPDKLLHIQIEDSPEAKISPFFRHLCHFIEIHLELGSVILIFSTRGISRSCAATVAYLMHQHNQTMKRSWAYVKKCKNNMRPNRGLVTQLLEWEKIVLGNLITDITDPLY
ncbi:serine/threonine/tyrosine-interacting-like protein 1 isoform X3 [Lemur catta]|nr:serine/threonine/tyrosine-interacting-like protein 1 isoform X3 [Lemur catta]XP_045399046.1 serine/threonine/tyrosine-interacting-like protein 1 isoform X3 [Lemur catta]